MKLFGSVVCVWVALTSVVSAGTPPSVEKMLKHSSSFYKLDEKTKQWVFIGGNYGLDECEAAAKDAATAGVADTLTVDVPFDSPDWDAGKHTVGELKALCNRAKRALKVKGWVNTFENGATVGPLVAANCVIAYQEKLAAKEVDGNLKLPYEGMTLKDPATGDPFVGTLDQARAKFCDAYAKEYFAEQAAGEEPYRKVLKGDKLDRALYEMGKMMYGKGKKELDTPEKLAKENVWFRETWYDEVSCAPGKVEYMVWRYEFDKNSMLKPGSGNSKKYCGPPAKSKFK
jgi:hypothetical protein